MAKKVSVALIDDIDNGKADETIEFSLDGVVYEIDLSKRNAKRLRAELATYVAHARLSGAKRRSTRQRGSGTRPAAGKRDESAAIRDWAQTQGMKVAERGRIPAAITERYRSEAGLTVEFSAPA